jgi:transposase
MTGSNPTDRSKLGTKRHILTDKKGIPLSVVLSSASTHDINLVTDVVDNAVMARRQTGEKGRGTQHLCLDKGYKSAQEEQKLIRRGYVLHIPRKKKKKKEAKDDKGYEQTTTTNMQCHKGYSPKRWVVERTNSWHNRFRKLFTRYEKKAENYLGLVQLSCCIIIYRKIFLG